MPEQQSELGAEPSLEQRIAQKFDLAQEPDPTDQPTESEPEVSPDEGVSEPDDEAQQVAFEDVEYEGKTYRVPVELKNGLMSKADYTRKTQEIARNREAMELQQKQIAEFQEQQRFEQTLQAEIGEVGTINYKLKLYEGLDWQKMEAGDMFRHRMEMDKLEKQRKELVESINGKRQAFSSEQQARMEDLSRKAAEVLQRSINGWNEEMAASVSEYALSRGFTQHQVDSIVNPRDIEIIWESMQYRKLLSTKEQALKKAAKAPPVVKPGSVKPMPKDVREKLDHFKAMKKAATPQEKAKLIQKRLEAKFR